MIFEEFFPSSLMASKLVNLNSEIAALFRMVKSYESYHLQKHCIDLVPITRLKDNAKIRYNLNFVARDGTSLPVSDTCSIMDESAKEECLLLELLHWFKSDFFSWPNFLQCKICKATTRFTGHNNESNTGSVSYFEEYYCPSCQSTNRFPRYTDAITLMQTRTGRCSEWSQIFCLLCRTLGWKARYVLDFNDHVWVEVYSEYKERWVHCDPCEAALDTPLMYESGWNKEPFFILAVSAYDIQDVTWRYSSKHASVRSRRTNEVDAFILASLFYWRKVFQRNFEESEKRFYEKILVQELVELMKEPKPISDYNEQTSSPLARQIDHRETGSLLSTVDHFSKNQVIYSPTSYPEKGIFEWTPSHYEIETKEFHIMYSCSKDIYIRNILTKDLFAHGWKSCIHSTSKLFRKYESDWEVVYLAREEECSSGQIIWKVNLTESNVAIDTIFVRSNIFCINNGKVRFDLFNSNSRVTFIRENVHNSNIEQRQDFFETSALRGSRQVFLSAELSGGEGTLAWQHSQLFRQPINDEDISFHVKLTLV